MKRFATMVCLIVLGICSVALVRAQTLDSSRNLVTDLGLDVVLLSFSRHVSDTVSQSEISRDKRLVSAWKRAAQDTLSLDHLEARLQTELSSKLGDSELDTIYQFLKSPLGRRITELEKQAQHPDMQAVAVSKGADLAQALSQERRAIFSGLMIHTRGHEYSTMVIMNGTAAAINGMKVGGVFPDSMNDEMVQNLIEQQKPRIEAALNKVLLPSAVFTYDSLGDGELAEYLKFLKSESGAILYGRMIPALDLVTSEAAVDFEKRLAELLAQAKETDL